MPHVHNTWLALCLVLLALVWASAAQAWNETGPRWTKPQARTILLSTPRIIASGGGGTYIFEPVQLIRFRPSGPRGVGGWRRFEVLLDFDGVRGDFHFGHYATFCLHAQKRGFWITGFDTMITSMNWQDIGYGLGCKDNARTRERTGRPYP